MKDKLNVPQKVKKPLLRQWWFWAVIVIVAISIMANLGKDKATNTVENIQAPQVTQAPQATIAPVVVFSNLTELTTSNIKDAISDTTIKDKITDIKIDGGAITVIVYDETFLSINSYIKQNQPHSASVFKDLFKNKNIMTVIYQSDISLTDAYGKVSRETAQTNTLERVDADKVSDWNTFAYESMSQYYSVVDYQLAPESKINGLHKAWSEIYS